MEDENLSWNKMLPYILKVSVLGPLQPLQLVLTFLGVRLNDSRRMTVNIKICEVTSIPGSIARVAK